MQSPLRRYWHLLYLIPSPLTSRKSLKPVGRHYSNSNVRSQKRGLLTQAGKFAEEARYAFEDAWLALRTGKNAVKYVEEVETKMQSAPVESLQVVWAEAKRNNPKALALQTKLIKWSMGNVGSAEHEEQAIRIGIVAAENGNEKAWYWLMGASRESTISQASKARIKTALSSVSLKKKPTWKTPAALAAGGVAAFAGGSLLGEVVGEHKALLKNQSPS